MSPRRTSTQTGGPIIDLMRHLNREGTTFAFSTHDHQIMERADCMVRLVDGRVVR